MLKLMEKSAITDLSHDERVWAVLAHALGFFFSFIAPLIIWLLQKEKFPLVDDQGREALNFQLSLIIYYIVAVVSSMIFIGFLLFPILFILEIIFIVQASIAANKGERYRYPLTIRFVK